ncbi:MAG: Amylo-alpha6-glucosidase [Candidatus Adlerbacteria bacterium]|nr:Amylo-alpha6-glucosidase [Candidatus Adlerbacteria bacterium]
MQHNDPLWELGLKSIRELETDEGILASSRGEAYGCIFGRDSLITALGLLKAYERTHDEYFLNLVEKVLRTLGNLQGRSHQIESGEQPGKIIHEFRPDNHGHLTALSESPWFIYPTGEMRNYDSVDSTPLFLMAVGEYSRLSKDRSFVISLLPNVRAGLAWILEWGDSNGDGFLDYSLHPERTFGGLSVQSWMDSTESVFYEDRAERPPYPIAPVEVQAYAWAALRAWADYFGALDNEDDRALAARYRARAADLKERFNEAFVRKGPRSTSLAFALDGKGMPLTAERSSVGHVLWAAYQGEAILDQEHMTHLRNRLMSRDMFVPQAGIRTLSSRSPRFDPVSYHNGSIWPHDTAMLAEGLQNFGFSEDARRVREALRRAYEHFKTPIELFGYRHGFKEYVHTSGQGGACRIQAWSAAALLSVSASY